ncbi:hypothetical protein [Streptomyces sp. NPDC018693]|uniref:hypothetical protein n=1 Tax=unclassified Streptomyces TaxID=2593676 RepID=UPI003790F84E
MSDSCAPTAFCPDHPDTVTGAGIAAGLFAVLALVLLAALALRTAVALVRRARPVRPRPARGQAYDGPTHVALTAAALNDWWHHHHDPAHPYDATAAAEHIHMYLASSGYHTRPHLGPLARAYARLRSARAIAGTRAHAKPTPTRQYTCPPPTDGRRTEP